MPLILCECALHGNSPKTSKLDLTDKSNLQVRFGSKGMASLYHLLCYHSLTSTDPLLEELLSYLPTRFHSRIFDFIAYEHSSDEESVHSLNSSVSAFHSDDTTYFSWMILFLFFIFTTLFRFTRFPTPLDAIYFMATTLQRRTTKRSDASTFFGSHF